MRYDLPKSVEVDGAEYEIRSDYRAILDIIEAIDDPELDEQEKCEAALMIFYPDLDSMPYCSYNEALEKCIDFINCGEKKTELKKQPRVMDWSQDFPLIVSPINRVLGCEIRALDYLHWFTFMAAYQEIGDCLFAQVVSIRKKKASGKKLDKSDQEFYKKNKNLVDLNAKYTEQDEETINRWV